MNKTKYFFIVTTVLFCVAGIICEASAVTGKIFSLKECLERTLGEGPNAKIAKQMYRSKIFTYRSFNGGQLPQLSLNATIPDYERAINPVIQPDGTTQYLAQAQANSSLGLTLTQPVVPTGGSLYVTSGLTRTDIVGDPLSPYWRSQPFVIGISQPLFQINTLWWDNKSNELQYTQAQKKFNEDMEDAASDVTQKFFDVYVAQMRVQNAELNVSINDTLLGISRGRFEVGKIDENDLLQSELALDNARSAEASAELDYRIALRTLAAALDLDEAEVGGIIPPDELPLVTVGSDDALRMAHQNRSDLVGFDLSMLLSERNLKSQQLSNGFSATITASYGYNQTANTYSDVYKNLLNQESARLDISIPILQWGKGSNAVAAASEDLDRTKTTVEMQTKAFDQDVHAQVERFVLNQQQLTLSMKADTIAQKQYTLATNRYLIGKYDVTKLLLAQDAKDKARESLIAAEQSYWLSYFRLRRVTLFDFERNQTIQYTADK